MTTHVASGANPPIDGPGSRIALLSWPGLLATAAVVAFAAWQGAGGLALLGGLILAIGVVARGWAALALAGLHYRRELDRTRVFAGESVTLAMTLDNRKPLPLGWVDVEEALPAALLPHPSEGDRIGFGTALGAFRTAGRRIEIPCPRRGYWRIGPATVTSGDVFGLFSRRRPVAPPWPLIVYPRLVPIVDPELHSRHPLGPMRDPARLFEDPSRLAGLRDYTPETPFKRIAWGPSARRGSLQAKMFETGVTPQIAIMLAIDAFALPAEEELLEQAIGAAASLAVRLLDLRREVGLFANGPQADGGGEIVLAPGRSPDRQVAILTALAKLECRATTPAAVFLERHASSLPRGTTLCVLAARPDAALLDRLGRGGRRATLLIVGPGPLPRGEVPARRLVVATAGVRR